MVSVVWDVKGVLYIDYLDKGPTITREYYSNLLSKPDKNICEKRWSLKKKKKIIFHQDNAPTHKNVLTMGKLRGLRMNCWNILPIFQIWLPQTYNCSQNSHCFLLVSVFNRIKR